MTTLGSGKYTYTASDSLPDQPFQRRCTRGNIGTIHGDQANRITKIELTIMDASATGPFLKVNPTEAMMTEETNPPTPVAANKNPPTSASW